MAGAADMRLIVKYFGRALSRGALSAPQLNASAPSSNLAAVGNRVTRPESKTVKSIGYLGNVMPSASGAARPTSMRSVSTTAASPYTEERLSAFELHRFGARDGTGMNAL